MHITIPGMSVTGVIRTRLPHTRLTRTVYATCIVAVVLVLNAVVIPSPARADSDDDIVRKINTLIARSWADNVLTASDRASDEEFVRRVSLDIVGHIPPYDELMAVLDDAAADRREKYVDALLDNPDHIRNMTSMWGNLLVGQANNRGGGRASLDQWLRNAFRSNIPYDRFVEELITAEGTSDENGAVVFLASHLNEQAVPATAITSRLFLGRQVQCTQCHNHPFNDWQQSQFWGMNAFFRGTRAQGNANRGGVTLTDAPAPPTVDFEKRNGTTVVAMRQFFDGSRVDTGGQLDVTVDIDELKQRRAKLADNKPRMELARFMLDSNKPYLAETQVNRLWGHFFGYAFTKPVDDMGPHNPASHPELLAYLGQQFKEAGYDNKRLIRWITRSDAYNLTSRAIAENEVDNPAAGEMPLFSHMYLKQFNAEQLYDSLLIATAADQANRNGEQAENQRRVWLQQFVQTFGTDENDENTTFNGTIPQALLLMNGQLMQNALGGGDGSFLRRVVLSTTGRIDDGKPAPKTLTQARQAQIQAARNRNRNLPAKIETLFLVALSRRPTEPELESFNEIYRAAGYSDPVVGLQDVFWSLLNSNEFIINH